MASNTGYKELLRYREYLFVLASSALSSFGFLFFQVVLFWLAYKMSSSTLQAAIIVQSSAMPYLLFGLVGGVFADKWKKKKIIVWNQVGTSVMFFFILLIFWMDVNAYWYLTVATFLTVSFRCFYSPAVRSLVSKTLPESLWPKGNAVFQLTQQVCRSISPIFAGILLANVTNELIFFILFILSILPVLFVIPLSIDETNGDKRVHVFLELKGTFAFLKTKKALLYSIIGFGFVLLLYTGMERLGLPIVSDSIWEMGSEGFSMILTLFGIGNAVGAIVLGKLDMKGYYSRYILLGCVLWGFGLMGVGLSQSIILALLFAFATGVTEAFIDLPMVLMIQKFSPEEKIGQVFSALSTIAFIGEAGSSMVIAFIIQFAGITNGFVVVAIGIAVICLITFLFIEKGKQAVSVEKIAQ